MPYGLGDDNGRLRSDYQWPGDKSTPETVFAIAVGVILVIIISCCICLLFCVCCCDKPRSVTCTTRTLPAVRTRK